MSVTEVPGRYDSLQSRPQLMPAGELATEPAPRPARVTLRTAVSKVAVTDASVVIGRTQLPVPIQAPDQPTNTALAAGAAVRITEVPGR